MPGLFLFTPPEPGHLDWHTVEGRDQHPDAHQRQADAREEGRGSADHCKAQAVGNRIGEEVEGIGLKRAL